MVPQYYRFIKILWELCVINKMQNYFFQQHHSYLFFRMFQIVNT